MNLTTQLPPPTTPCIHVDEPGDATWILTSAFIIFTMQSGFGLLEAGMVSSKNEANIMVKNAIDVIFGGLAYWIFGYGFSFGPDGNGFSGYGFFLTDANEENMGHTFSKYIFQLSFATTATTIVSGAMAERTKLKSYIIYSFFNTVSYCFPAHWVWDDKGFLRKMGAIDVAGCAPVHMIGGVSALIATIILKPRHGRFDKNTKRYMASPPSVILGTFMLWWGWLGFNCGSTFGISGHKWKLASRAAVVTINGSIGGGIFAVCYSYSRKDKYNGCLDIGVFVTGILGGLVGCTAICAICKPWEALIIGAVGAIVAILGDEVLEKMKIDDPVSCISVHFLSGIWGVLAVALFAEKDGLEGFSGQYGIFKGGSIHILYVQMLMVGTTTLWASLTTAVLLLTIDSTIGLRTSLENELGGADIHEHGLNKYNAEELIHNQICKMERKKSEMEQQQSVLYNCNVSFQHCMMKNSPGSVNDHVIDIDGEKHSTDRSVSQTTLSTLNFRERKISNLNSTEIDHPN